MKHLRNLGITALTAAVYALLWVNVSAQPRQVASVVHFEHKIASKVLGEERTILVRVPQNYQRSDERFPVVVMLDAHPPQNAMMAGLLEQQAWGGKLPEMILVGVQNTNRTRDMTPTVSERANAGGGAAKFLDFIASEVIPLVDGNYRTQPYRILAGHSLAGLFVVYTLVERPELFNSYIAASPYLHWDRDHIVKRAEARLRPDTELRKQVFVGLGGEPDYLNSFYAFQALLKKVKPKGLAYRFEQFKDESHGSVVLDSYHHGLRMIFDGWDLSQVNTLADIESHYRRLSERFGYTVAPPENLVNQMGYILLRGDRTDEAIEAFRKNTELYPNSANVYDSFAEALERAGKLQLARDNYEKAWKMADQRGESQLAASAKANFERLAAKLK